MELGLFVIIPILFWLILSFIIADIAKDKKIGFWIAFLVSLTFTPFFGILCVIASPTEIIIPVESKPIIDPDFTKNFYESIEAYNQKDYDKAIILGLNALYLNVNSANMHYNLAILYSLKTDKINSYKHLSRAIECGFNNYKKIVTEPDLEWVRSQSDFKDFMVNGYKVK